MLSKVTISAMKYTKRVKKIMDPETPKSDRQNVIIFFLVRSTHVP